MIKIKRLIFVLLSSIITIGCGNPKNENGTKSENVQTENKSENLIKLEREASRLRAGSSIKLIKLDNDKAIIKYVKDYKGYKKLNPQSRVSKTDWEIYWETSDGVEKAIVDSSVKLMKKLDFLNQVEITIPYKGRVYSIDVEKSELESFIGSNFKTILADWDKKFSNPYVYNDKGRRKFFSKFGSVQ